MLAKRDIPLAPYTSYGVGGPAEFFGEPSSIEESIELVRGAEQLGLKVRFLGLGTNLLVDDAGVSGLVICTRRLLGKEGEFILAGTALPGLLREMAEVGLSGLEPLTGIPGSVGGAVIMNAGTRFGSIQEVLHSVCVVDGGGISTVDGIKFGYRTSSLRGRFVVGVRLELREDSPGDVKERMADFLRSRKDVRGRSAGSVFKNPPEAPAGRLIEEAGLRGYVIGGASISEAHANWIVCRQGARAEHIARLIGLIRSRLPELSLELDVWSERDEFLELCGLR